MDMSDRYGHVHNDAPIDFEQLFEPLIAEFFSSNIDRSLDICIDHSTTYTEGIPRGMLNLAD